MVLAGSCFGFDIFFFNIALHNTSVANVNLITSLVCFILVPIGILFFKERVTKGFFIGGTITLFGVVVLLKGQESGGVSHIYGDFLAVISTIFYGLFLSLIFTLRRIYHTMEIMFFASLGSSATLLILALIFEGIVLPKNINEFAMICLLAFCGQILGQGFFSYIIGKINTQISSLILLSSPALGAIMGFVFLGERIALLEIIGIIIVIIGVYFAKLGNH